MPRKANTRPTNIYWLIDMRPEVLVKWPIGMPFYCGKTVREAQSRFTQHLRDAPNCPNRASAARILECAGSVCVKVMEIVPPEDSWAAREKHWIHLLRHLNPLCVNVSDGGAGVPGYVPTSGHRAKLSAAKKGKKFTAAHVANMSAVRIGKKQSPEAIAKSAASRRGKSLTAEHRAKISQAHKGRKLPAWQVELLRNVHLGSKHTPEQIEKTASKHRGMKRPPGTGAKISAANKGKIISEEAKAKMRAAKIGKKQTPEHIANMKAAVTGKPKSEAHRMALKAAWERRRLTMPPRRQSAEERAKRSVAQYERWRHAKAVEQQSSIPTMEAAE